VEVYTKTASLYHSLSFYRKCGFYIFQAVQLVKQLQPQNVELQKNLLLSAAPYFHLPQFVTPTHSHSMPNEVTWPKVQIIFANELIQISDRDPYRKQTLMV
jgi:hypothetical protein